MTLWCIHLFTETRSKLMASFVIFQLPFGTIYICGITKKNVFLKFAASLALIGTAFFVIFYLNFEIFHTASALRMRIIIPLGDSNEYEKSNIQENESKISSEPKRFRHVC